MLESLTSLFTLTILEVVLSIDNLVVIAVLVGKLPKDRQASACYVGMTLPPPPSAGRRYLGQNLDPLQIPLAHRQPAQARSPSHGARIGRVTFQLCSQVTF